MKQPIQLLAIRAAGLPSDYRPWVYQTACPLELPFPEQKALQWRDERLKTPDYSRDYPEAVLLYFDFPDTERAWALARYWKMKGAWVLLSGTCLKGLGDEARQYGDTLINGAGTLPWDQIQADILQGRLRTEYLSQSLSGGREQGAEPVLDWLELGGPGPVLSEPDPAEILQRLQHADLVLPRIWTPLPASPEYHKLDREGRILERRHHCYDGFHQIFETEGYSREQLRNCLVRAMFLCGYYLWHRKNRGGLNLARARWMKRLWQAYIRAWRGSQRALARPYDPAYGLHHLLGSGRQDFEKT